MLDYTRHALEAQRNMEYKLHQAASTATYVTHHRPFAARNYDGTAVSFPLPTLLHLRPGFALTHLFFSPSPLVRCVSGTFFLAI